MKAHLMYRDRDLATTDEPVSNAEELIQDLELSRLFDAMAAGDRFLYDVARRVVLASLEDREAIIYRQHVLGDCVAEPRAIRELYEVAVHAVAAEKHVYMPLLNNSPSGVLHRSIEAMEVLVESLKELRRLSDEHAGSFASEGLTTLCAMLAEELTDEYFDTVAVHLRRLQLRDGILVSAKLGKGNRGSDYVLRSPGGKRPSLKERIGIGPRSYHAFEVNSRDEAGFRALAELTDRGVNLAADALAQSIDHIRSFFTMLCWELGFYVGCLDLHDRLLEQGHATCVPIPEPARPIRRSCSGLYDVCLALSSSDTVVGNDLNGDGKSLVVITGANSGGKSTFLRSIGLAQLMMQCGMFVGAESFTASVGDRLFTHFIREEDATMTSGKLDEEMARMSMIADALGPTSVVLFNESFAATNEREGSEIARQVVRALLESGVTAFFVTHMFDLADSLFKQHSPFALFLRAEREADGRRPFKLVEGAPLPTSYGRDIYEDVGGWRRPVPVPAAQRGVNVGAGR